MSTQIYPPQQKIISVPIKKLHPHPDNPNRISQAKFNKLARHIKTTGQYEPLVVRKHPSKLNAYQILNGHHRLRILKQLCYTCADCIVFKASDEQAEVYLLSLNRLCGRDNVYRKAKLIEQLCKTHSSNGLAKLLGDSKTTIEKLNTLSQDQPLPTKTQNDQSLLPMTFFLDRDQHALITQAFESTNADLNTVTHTQQRIDAFMQIVKEYLDRLQCSKPPCGD